MTVLRTKFSFKLLQSY